MKQCPACSRTYSDDSQQFCLQDGTPLIAAQPSQPASMGGGPHPTSRQPPGVKKRSIWPWVLGGVALLAVVGVVLVAVVGVVLYKVAEKNSNTQVGRTGSNTRGAPEANENAKVDVEVDTEDTELYTNSRDSFTGTLATNYVDFSFRYPDDWELDPKPEPSFVRLTRNNASGATIENFSVGWFAATGGSPVGNTALLSQVTNNFSTQISGNFPNYTKVGEGSTTVGRYSAYELRFTGMAGKDTTREVPFWGRIVVIPDPNGGSKGVSMIMLATGHSSDVKGQADVGEKGELPIILNTFKLGS